MILAALVGALSIALVGGAAPTGAMAGKAGSNGQRLCSGMGRPTAVRIIRYQTTRVPAYVVNKRPIDRTISGRPVVRRLYGVVCALPVPAQWPWIDTRYPWGIQYHLVFERNSRTILVVTTPALIGSLLVRGWRGRGPDYWTGRGPLWDLLARALGVRRESLFPHVRIGY